MSFNLIIEGFNNLNVYTVKHTVKKKKGKKVGKLATANYTHSIRKKTQVFVICEFIGLGCESVK